MKGISGVVVAVLLTVIGIVAVLMFWATFGGIISGTTPRVMIEKASFVKTGQQVYGTVTVREVGGASTSIEEIVLKADQEFQCTPTGDADKNLSPGGSKTIECTVNSDLATGKTYYLIVRYKVGDKKEPTDPYPVTIR